MNVDLEQRLIAKIRQMPIQRILEVEDFIDFLNYRDHQPAQSANLADQPQPRPRRTPPPSIAGGGQTLGDIVSPIVDEEDWECLK